MPVGSESQPVVFLMGPTGSGKTAAALALARDLPLEIVSVDSALVYRGMDIGTAKPNRALRAQVPHHLIDIRAPSQPYSAAQFRADALDAIAAIRTRGHLPLLTGGTGLYFRALEHGIAPLPQGDAAQRAQIARELDAYGSRFLHAQLAGIDPQAARRIHPRDPQRICRALEVFRLSGRPISAWWADAAHERLTPAPLKLVLAPADRERLHQRVASRFHDMLARGLVNEVRRLRECDELHIDLPAMRSVGYREVWRYLDGTLDYPSMAARAITATRRLARRQLTWFRRESATTWVDSDAADVVARIGRVIRAAKASSPD